MFWSFSRTESDPSRIRSVERLKSAADQQLPIHHVEEASLLEAALAIIDDLIRPELLHEFDVCFRGGGNHVRFEASRQLYGEYSNSAGAAVDENSFPLL